MLLNSDLLKKNPSMRDIHGNPLVPEATLNPCGLIAANYFSDRFEIVSKKENDADGHGEGNVHTSIEINRNNITHAIDREYFKKLPDDQNEAQWIDVQNEGFIVWMYMETFSNFKKKWGNINKNLEPGKYTLIVDYNWDNPTFDTQKHFVVLSGVENTFRPFFGYTLIIVGEIFFITTLVLIYNRYKKKKNFNPNDLRWE
jgi:hypothetical protein